MKRKHLNILVATEPVEYISNRCRLQYNRVHLTCIIVFSKLVHRFECGVICLTFDFYLFVPFIRSFLFCLQISEANKREFPGLIIIKEFNQLTGAKFIPCQSFDWHRPSANKGDDDGLIQLSCLAHRPLPLGRDQCFFPLLKFFSLELRPFSILTQNSYLTTSRLQRSKIQE